VGGVIILLDPLVSNAAFGLPGFGVGRPPSLYVVTPERNLTDSLLRTEASNRYALTAELCLLKLLPVKKKFFREIEDRLEILAGLKETREWREASREIDSLVSDIDRRRGSLEPVFNPEDSAIKQIEKGEYGELLIDGFRSRCVDLQAAIRAANETGTDIAIRQALLALSYVGELLVSSFPFEVPSEGKFSYLPRLLGRAKVTFTFRRKTSILGNVTIIADGFAAPMTAGNFVDLCVRQFYTGLPVKFQKKRLGRGSDFDVANVPILGSYNEGFYEPLTAQLRRLPLELIRVEKSSGVPNLAYSQGGFETSLEGQATLEPSGNSEPLLSFDIPGLVAMNHPDRNPNGASSEFFSLLRDSVAENKRRLLDGEFAPFGYIIDGFDVFQSLKPDDVIDSTVVDELGQLNLVKLRQSRFSEVVQGSEE
jgi:cyclophilin family peptidyl-prolyl cis-trans isomerase